MKRCPECEFLYEDEQDHCDMDGASLNVTALLLPQPARPPLKTIWRGFTIPLLVLVLLGTVLVILYRATPPSFSSSPSVKKKEAVNQDLRRPASAASPELVTTPAISPEPDEPSTGTQPKATKSNRRLPSTNTKEPTVVPESHIQIEPASPTESSPKPPTSQIQENAASPESGKPQAGSDSIAAQPTTPAPQPGTQKQEKDSKLKSFFKKAGRILKKPF
jgi:hypothetical protein